MSGGPGGWLDQLEIRLNSASVAVEVEVEVEAELGKNTICFRKLSVDSSSDASADDLAIAKLSSSLQVKLQFN